MHKAIHAVPKSGTPFLRTSRSSETHLIELLDGKLLFLRVRPKKTLALSDMLLVHGPCHNGDQVRAIEEYSIPITSV